MNATDRLDLTYEEKHGKGYGKVDIPQSQSIIDFIKKYKCKGYKVVNKDLQSVTMTLNNPEIAVEYQINEWVSSKVEDTPLLIFDTLINAHKFREKYGWCTSPIFECEYIPFNKDSFKSPLGDSEVTVESFPKGTIFASQVKLLGDNEYKEITRSCAENNHTDCITCECNCHEDFDILKVLCNR